VGSDNRGTMTHTSIAGTVTYKFAIAASGEFVFIEFDNSGTRGAGIIDKGDHAILDGAGLWDVCNELFWQRLCWQTGWLRRVIPG